MKKQIWMAMCGGMLVAGAAQAELSAWHDDFSGELNVTTVIALDNDGDLVIRCSGEQTLEAYVKTGGPKVTGDVMWRHAEGVAEFSWIRSTDKQAIFLPDDLVPALMSELQKELHFKMRVITEDTTYEDYTLEIGFIEQAAEMTVVAQMCGVSLDNSGS